MPRNYRSFPRLYVEHSLRGGEVLRLGHDQTSYLLTVLRLKADDSVILFNGRDGAWLARIVEPHRKGATLELQVQTAPQTPPSDLWYGFAPLKTSRLDYVVQKATEMGAGIIQPVTTRFTQVHRLKREKLIANVIEAAEQCEVLSIPRVEEEVSLPDVLSSWREVQGLRRLVVCDEAAPSGSPIEQLGWLEGLPVGVLVGPEGGFADDERELLLAQSYVIPVSLGPRILRADTAAVAVLAAIQATIGDWR